MTIKISPDLNRTLKNFSLPRNLEFGKTIVPIMVKSVVKNNQWSELELLPYEDIKLSPSAMVFFYGQEIFEGLKAFKSKNNEIGIFRPIENFKRFNQSAERMAMPPISESMFLESISSIVTHAKDFIPTEDGSSLYLRPFMIATEPGLRVKPAEEFLYMVVASPSGPYFKDGAIKVYVEKKFARAAEGGMGSAKTGGNYAGSLYAEKLNKEKGFHQTLWLSSSDHESIEELSGMNFFAVINNELYTPKLNDSILPGITRDSILKLAKARGLKTHEEKMSVSELFKSIENKTCTECFACGTAAVITHIESLSDDKKSYQLKNAQGEISTLLKKEILDIQNFRKSSVNQWMYRI